MSTEPLLVGETKNFRGLIETDPTIVAVSIPGAEPSGDFTIACPGVGKPKPVVMSPTDTTPVDLRLCLWGTVFVLVNSGTVDLQVDTNATLEP